MKSLLVFVFSLLSVSPVLAQKGGGQVKMKINLVAWGNDVSGLTLKKPSGETTVARAFTYNETLNYSGPQVLSIYKIESERPVVGEGEEEEEGYVAPEPAASEEAVDLSLSLIHI